MRMPEPGPLGETFLEAKLRAIAAALLVKSPSGGWVESVFTLATHCLGLDFFELCFLGEITHLQFASQLEI